MLKLSNLKGGDLNKIEQALNLLKNLKISDGNNELSFKSFNKANSSMTFLNQKGGEIKLELNAGSSLYSETSDAFIGGGDYNGMYSETSDAFIRGGGHSNNNELYSETSELGSMRGGYNNSETSLNSVGINNVSMLSETSIDNAYSATSAMDNDNHNQFNLQNLFIKANGGAKDSNNTLSLSSITELKERNNANMSVLRNKGLLGGGAKSISSKLKTYDINSSSTNSVCE
jgi:hypothetical protein